MKKIIYCFGMMTLIAALIGDAEAMSRVRGRAKGKGWAESTNPANVFVENAKGELVEVSAITGLPVPSKTSEQRLQAQNMLDGRAGHISLAPHKVVEYDAVAHCLVERDLNTGCKYKAETAKAINFLAEQLYAQQKLLKGHARELEHVGAFCEKVQALLK